MPIDNIDKLKRYEDDIAERIADWESRSVAEIAHEIGQIGKMSKPEAEKYDIEKETRKRWEWIVSALAATVNRSIRDTKKAYQTSFEQWHKDNKSLYDYKGVPFSPIEDDEVLNDIMQDYIRQSSKELISLVNTKALSCVDSNGMIVRLSDEIWNAFSEAVKNVTEGKTDFYSSMRKTVQALGGSGIRVDYGDGVTRRLDTVARQNLLWGIKQSHREYNAAVGAEIGTDGIEIDYHTNSRPTHRYMQGKQYSKGEGKTVNGVYYPSAEKEGVYARLYEDYGCLHYETDVILGISVPRYSEAEIRQFEEQDSKVYNIGGTEKDGYGWKQTMRQLETEIRKSKDEINALQAFGNSASQIEDLEKRIERIQAKYKQISDVTGIREEPNRMG